VGGQGGGEKLGETIPPGADVYLVSGRNFEKSFGIKKLDPHNIIPKEIKKENKTGRDISRMGLR